MVVQFAIFVALVWLLLKITRARQITLRGLVRLLALSLAPCLLTVVASILGYSTTNLLTEVLATRLPPNGLIIWGTIFGYYADDLTVVLSIWGYAIAIGALRAVGVSWGAAGLAVAVAARFVGPLPEFADLLMNGVR